jgi:hypothetical protein
MSDSFVDYSYDQEEEIVWLEPADTFRYVREALVLCRFRARQPHTSPDSHLIAYSTLRGDARPERTHRFLRRAWYAVPESDHGTVPVDAVDPRSVRASFASLRAEDALLPLMAEGEAGEFTEGMRAGGGATEPEAPGVAFRVKRVSVPRDPTGAASVLRRHFTPEELRELATALNEQAMLAEHPQHV